MSNYHSERTALFIDGANLHATARSLGFDIDFGGLLEHYRQQGHLIRSLYYTAISENQEYSSLRPLVDWLDYNGFTMITKPMKEFTDNLGNRKSKGNMDVELAVDALKLAPSLDHIVLFSGDANFRALVGSLQEMGKRVSVVSTLETKPAMIADELRRQADHFVDLVDLEPFIARDRGRTSAKQVRPTAISNGVDD
ncbi:MAG: NYN domain-containing protein [Hyphomicrobiaceae bacterium]